MKQPIEFREWLYHNHGFTSISQVRNKEKYINAYETYCENLKEASMSNYERELDKWQTTIAPITYTFLIVMLLIMLRFIDS